jgi:CMP-2-keto-3-deoxyoctulosonic acid synthetase
MNPIVIIPARMAATRLPGKPLADVGGLSMIVRVMRQAQAADIGPVVVAAGDREIVDAIQRAGGRAVLTDPNLPSGSDRIQAALAILDPTGSHDAVINLQGDMPFVPAAPFMPLVPFMPLLPFVTVTVVPSGQVTVALPLLLSFTVHGLPFSPAGPVQATAQTDAATRIR